MRFLVAIHGLVKRTGLLDLAWFQRIFGAAYFYYKRRFEDPYFALLRLRPDLLQRGHVLDIGANIGYTATLFSRAIEPGFRVYAFEPEPWNFVFLERTIERMGLGDRIMAVQAAVGERTGVIELWCNEDHHGDHRVLTSRFRESGVDAGKAVPVPMTTVDQFVTDHGLGTSVCFIKIDVQGYELPVCRGLENTLADNPRMVVAVEYMPQAMAELGFSPTELPAFFRTRGYRIHLVLGRGSEKGRIREVSDDELSLALERRGYVDILASRHAL